MPISYSAVHVEGPFIAMTFDDGPSEKLTPELLDILAQHHIHATFFVIGKNAVEHPEILQRAVREGHEIGNHSWSHPAFAKMSDARVRAELQKTDDAIRDAHGWAPGPDAATLRLDHRAAEAMDQRGIRLSHHPMGRRSARLETAGPDVVTSRIVKETRPGSIILSHDIHPGTIKAMPETFDQLQAKGFKFVTVSELIAMGKPMAPQRTDSEGPSPTCAGRESTPPAAVTSRPPRPA